MMSLVSWSGVGVLWSFDQKKCLALTGDSDCAAVTPSPSARAAVAASAAMTVKSLKERIVFPPGREPAWANNG
jgi:hypothetical protein